jgi:transposase InsO family protein
MYGMSRDELVELRKQLTDLLDKGWIRASSSAAGAPVLLVKKAGGGMRFCVDYRALNKMSLQDRYPLPLIKETLRSLADAKWLTKVDVRAAFHRIRMAPGDEHLTAFRTRFGLFEWLVCPFGLAGAPASFQRYINSVLRDLLDVSCTAYLDDILIYSSGSREDHMAKVQEVLQRLLSAGLNLDLKKCEFAVQKTKYLGYIIECGVGISADPEKIAAVRDWEAPTTVKGVRGFVGFANFYRNFIANFSETAGPLIALTRKGTTFTWGDTEQTAFETLKTAFITAPILAQWDPDLETTVEADCSGDALGGCLSQWGKDNILRPIGYHSAKLTPAERNYTIHDKELLAIISSLKAWSAELRSVRKPFTILTDHKNLEYFMTTREVTERQARWAELLSQYNYLLKYRPGPQCPRPDALSRRDQDATQDGDERMMKVLRPISVETLGSCQQDTRKALGMAIKELQTEMEESLRHDKPQPGPEGAPAIFRDAYLQKLWTEALKNDTTYWARVEAVRRGERTFPREADTKLQIADCTTNAHGALQFKGRLWLPASEPLRTTILQRVHDSPITGHSGAANTFRSLARDFHWDGMSGDVKRFQRNCDVCKRIHPSRKARQGLLSPLPVPDRFWKQVSVDFMTDLPARTDEEPRHLMVLTDRLSKYVQLEAMTSMTAEACARRFRDCWWRFRGFPEQLISDRGSDWVGTFWTSLSKAVGMEQLLSTAYHPQTDGGTERMNQEVQAYLRAFVNLSQMDWPEHLAAAQLALNNRDSSVTGVSPNRLLLGFEVDPVRMETDDTPSRISPKGRTSQFAAHLREGIDLAQAAMAFAQQGQEDSANRRRRAAERYKVGDEVWLSLRNVKTDRPSKKLDWLYAKYKVTATPTPLTVRLDVPTGIHPTFHVDLIERAATDPLPSQTRTDNRPPPVMVPVTEDGPLVEEYRVDEVIRMKNGRGRGGPRMALVKWTGWDEPTWEPLEVVQGTEALDRFETIWGDARTHNGPVSNRKRRINQYISTDITINNISTRSPITSPRGPTTDTDRPTTTLYSRGLGQLLASPIQERSTGTYVIQGPAGNGDVVGHGLPGAAKTKEPDRLRQRATNAQNHDGELGGKAGGMRLRRPRAGTAGTTRADTSRPAHSYICRIYSRKVA